MLSCSFANSTLSFYIIFLYRKTLIRVNNHTPFSWPISFQNSYILLTSYSMNDALLITKQKYFIYWILYIVNVNAGFHHVFATFARIGRAKFLLLFVKPLNSLLKKLPFHSFFIAKASCQHWLTIRNILHQFWSILREFTWILVIFY